MSESVALASLHPALGLLQLLGAGLLAAITISTLHTAWSLTHPPRRTYAWAIARRVPGDPSELTPPRAYEPFTFRGVRQTLPAWRVPADNPAGPVVVMTHGWGSSRIGGLKRLAPVLPHAREVILWDLPGHGESPGPARMGTDEHRDLQRLLEIIAPGPDRPPIVLFGWSLGAGVSIRAAAENAAAHDLRAVIAEAPYIHAPTPARSVIRLRGLPYRLNLPPAMALMGLRLGVGPHWNGFARDRHAKRLGPISLTVIHGTDDPVCPIADARTIADAAPNGRLITIPHAGHNNLWTDPVLEAQARRAVEDALRAASDPPTEPDP